MIKDDRVFLLLYKIGSSLQVGKRGKIQSSDHTQTPS